VISVTAVGQVEKDKVVYRSGAKPNDILCVTGDLGAAYVGLQIMEREKQVYLANPDMQPQFEARTTCSGGNSNPRPAWTSSTNCATWACCPRP
jgi:thiamine-monophosphate kinase